MQSLESVLLIRLFSLHFTGAVYVCISILRLNRLQHLSERREIVYLWRILSAAQVGVWRKRKLSNSILPLSVPITLIQSRLNFVWVGEREQAGRKQPNFTAHLIVIISCRNSVWNPVLGTLAWWHQPRYWRWDHFKLDWLWPCLVRL